MRTGNEYAVEKTMKRTKSSTGKSRKVYRSKLTLCIATFVIIAGLSIVLGSSLVSAHDKNEQPEQKF